MGKVIYNLFDEIDGEEDLSAYNYMYDRDSLDKSQDQEEARLYIEDPQFDIGDLEDTEEEIEEETEERGYITWNINSNNEEEEE